MINNSGLNLKHSQRGMTFFGLVFVMIILAFTAVIAMKILPIYINYYQVYSSLEGLKSEPGLGADSKAEVMKRIRARFDISQIYSPDPDEVIKLEKKGRTMEVILDYEDRRNVMGNLEVVGVFKDVIILQ